MKSCVGENTKEDARMNVESWQTTKARNGGIFQAEGPFFITLVKVQNIGTLNPAERGTKI
jgi:hypothetical protein